MIYDKKTYEVLKNWFTKHESHPYATKEQKIDLANLTSLSEKQVTAWLINARRKKSMFTKND